MTQDRWQQLRALTWFGDEQREVTDYVAELRSRLSVARDALSKILMNTDDQCAEEAARYALALTKDP